jgi:hypothetical protein
MIDESIFKTEIRIPDEIESMLKVSLHHEGLKHAMKFIMQMLDRHEKAMKLSLDKSKRLAPEISQLTEFQLRAEAKIEDQSTKLDQFSEIVSKFDEFISTKEDSSEGLKFALSMITSHDSAIAKTNKLLHEAFEENKQLRLRIVALENSNKEVLDHVETYNASIVKAQQIINDRQKRQSKFETRVTESIDDISIISNESRRKTFNIEIKDASILEILDNTPKAHDTKDKCESSAQNAEKLKEKQEKFEEKPKEKHHKQEKLEEKLKEKQDKVEEKKFEKLKTPISKKMNIYEAVFPFPNKVYTESEKLANSAVDTPKDSKVSNKSSIILPSAIKSLETRIETIERILAQTETTTVYSRLDHFETLVKSIESSLDKVEPQVTKNLNQIQRLSKKAQNIEKEMMNKLNTEHFDAVKALVLAIASGESRKNYPKVDHVTAKELNYVENFNKRISELETLYIEHKITGISFDEVVFKLQRIEKKLDFKADTTEIESTKQRLNSAIDQMKVIQTDFSSGKEKKQNNVSLKPADSALIASINRKFLTYEETMRSLRLPDGTSLMAMHEETQKLWEVTRFILNTLEAYSNQYDAKISEIAQKASVSQAEKILQQTENELKACLKSVSDNFERKFADKFEMLRGFKYVESALNRMEQVLKKVEGDEAILARKPLVGWSCGSCEKSLEKLSGKTATYKPWNKLPMRDAKDRITKAGNAYSKMLCTTPLEPIKKRHWPEDLLLPSGIQTDRSITPQPSV